MKNFILHLFLFPAYLFLEFSNWIEKRKRTYTNIMAFVGAFYTIYMILVFIDKIIENL
jgi:hypothetical protein